MRATIIRPGFLIGLKSTATGGVEYRRRDLDCEAANEARWETTRVIYDQTEHEAAGKARNKARAEITKLCSATSFGLLCPLANEPELDAAIQRAQAIAAAFNATAKFTRVNVYALKGKIAETDEQASRAIASEIQGLIQLMTDGIDKLDPSAIREAANKARELSMMLGTEEQEKVEDAIKQARTAARMIVSRVEKKGEDAAIVLADVQRGNLEKARIAFLDFSDEVAPTGEAMPIANVQRMSGLDVDTGEVH
jgi:oligoendopeptidase F